MHWALGGRCLRYSSQTFPSYPQADIGFHRSLNKSKKQKQKGSFEVRTSWSLMMQSPSLPTYETMTAPSLHVSWIPVKCHLDGSIVHDIFFVKQSLWATRSLMWGVLALIKIAVVLLPYFHNIVWQIALQGVSRPIYSLPIYRRYFLRNMCLSIYLYHWRPSTAWHYNRNINHTECNFTV